MTKTAKQRAFSIYEKFPELLTAELQAAIVQQLQEAIDEAKPKQLIAWPFEQVMEEMLGRCPAAALCYLRDDLDGGGLKYHLRYNGPLMATLHLSRYLAERAEEEYAQHLEKGTGYTWES